MDWPNSDLPLLQLEDQPQHLLLRQSLAFLGQPFQLHKEEVF